MYFNKSSMDLSLAEASKEFSKLKSNIRDLLYKMGDDCDNLRVNREDLDQEFMRDQYRILTESLDDIYYRLEYLTKSVVEQGYIKHNDAKRYTLPSGMYFTTGSTLEILYKDTKYDEQYWLYTSIEHKGSDYYAKALGPDVSINGMLVRIRK